MDSVEISDPEKIREILKGIVLEGKGFTTECLLVDVYEAGLTYPDYFKASGEDPNASLNGVSPAWESYHLRQGKKVFMVYGQGGSGRRLHTTETP